MSLVYVGACMIVVDLVKPYTREEKKNLESEIQKFFYLHVVADCSHLLFK